MKIKKTRPRSGSPDIEWERMEYSLKNGATVEIIREKVVEEDASDDILAEMLEKE